MTFELFDQSARSRPRRASDAVDPDLWDAVFPPDDSRSGGRVVPDWSERHWRTFRAGDGARLGQAAPHRGDVLADPTSPPPPAEHPLTEAIQESRQVLPAGTAASRAGTRERAASTTSR